MMLDIAKLSVKEKKKLAQNENTPSDVLYLLSKENKMIRRLVARNPNSSIEVLKKIGIEFADEIVSNPVFDLLLLEKPKSGFLKMCLAASSTTPAKTLEKLSCDRDYKVLAEIISNPNVTTKIIQTLIGNTKFCRLYIDYILGYSDKFSEEVWKMLATNSNAYIRYTVAHKSKIPINILIWLAEDYDSHLRSRTALNTNMPAAMLTKLANDSARKVRRSVASNRNTPIAILTKLANDSAMEVRHAVALNRNVSIAILTKLANDSDVGVRYAVASNRNTLAESLIKLADDSAVGVRYAVASNPNVPIATLTKLASDSARKVRHAVASNPNAPKYLLNELADFPSKFIRKIVARNPNTPVNALAKLANDPIKSVRKCVTNNPNTPLHVLILLTKTIKNYSLREAALSKNNRDRDILISVLGELATSSDWVDRKIAAENQNTPMYILEKLKEDSNRCVRMSANDNIGNHLT